MIDFSNYEQSMELYELSGGLLPEIAEAAGYELTDEPESANLGGLIGRLGPDKEYQKNISVVHEALGGDFREQIADWIERSGIMYPVERSLVKPITVPERIDTVVFSGGVANWMLRRAGVVQRLNPEAVGQVILPIGERQMATSEHQLVKTYEKQHGQRPTEAQFAQTYLIGNLAAIGFDMQLLPVESVKGAEVLDVLFTRTPEILEGTVVVAANAPNAIQAAGELRLAGQRADDGFDQSGEQVFMVSDSFPLARRGEAPKTHQNPETALGQLIRNAKFLVDNQIVA